MLKKYDFISLWNVGTGKKKKVYKVCTRKQTCTYDSSIHPFSKPLILELSQHALDNRQRKSWQLNSQSQGDVELSVHLTGMTLDCGWKPEHLQETHAGKEKAAGRSEAMTGE